MKKKNAGKIILGIMFGVIVVLSAILAMLNIRNKIEQNSVSVVQEVQTADPEEAAGEENKTEAEKILESMTLEEKAAQIFFVTPEDITGVNTATVAGDATRQALETYPVGGIVYFSKNILSGLQQR